MAQQSELNNVPTEAGLRDISSARYKILIKELIRLDVPLLEVGSSSIGKSYSIRQFAEEAGVASEFLFVGTEKSEFIEGIPNLKGVTGDTAKFSYLKPYWFPDKDKIRARLTKGRDELKNLVGTNEEIKNMYSKAFEGDGQYIFVEELKLSLLKFKKTKEQVKIEKKVETDKEGNIIKKEEFLSRYVYADSLLYLSNLQGYGNFWLILDEIDKVEKQDKDKYAPLLHIVRERELKGWKLSGLRGHPEYDIKFCNRIGIRKKRFDAALDNPEVDVTDTRIIAIANDLKNMEKESPALYRRFVKIVIKESLYDPKAFEMPEGEQYVPIGFDWAAFYEQNRMNVHGCIVEKSIAPNKIIVESKQNIGVNDVSSRNTIGGQMAIIADGLAGKRLDEMNLQWTLGFLPELLYGVDKSNAQGTTMPTSQTVNLLREDFNSYPVYETLYFKLISDNFVEKYWQPVMTCILKEIKNVDESKNKEIKVKDEADDFIARAGLSIEDFDNPDPKKAELLIDNYRESLIANEVKFKESFDLQKKKSGSKALAGVAEGVNVRANLLIEIGFKIIEKSLIKNKPTLLTKMLVSSIPFVQTKLICHSPYIPYDGAITLTKVQDGNMVRLIKIITGKSFDNESQALSAAQEVFTMIEPYKPFVVKYAVGVPGDLVDEVVDNNYTNIKENIKTIVEQIIANGPVIIDNNIVNLLVTEPQLKIKYFNSLANVKLIEKEVYINIGLIWIMIINSAEIAFNDEVKKSIDYYAERFPNIIITLANSPNTPEEVADYAIMKANDVKANPNDYMIAEIDKIQD